MVSRCRKRRKLLKRTTSLSYHVSLSAPWDNIPVQVQYSTVHPCTGLQYSTVHPCTGQQYSTVHPCTGTVQYSTVHPCTGLQYSTVHPCTDLQCSEGVTKLLRCTVEGQGPLKLYAYACKLPQIILFVLYKKCFLIVLWNLWSNH